MHYIHYYISDTTQNSINDNENDDLYTSTSSIGLGAVDDVTIKCWWRHNDQTSVTRARENWNLTR